MRNREFASFSNANFRIWNFEHSRTFDEIGFFIHLFSVGELKLRMQSHRKRKPGPSQKHATYVQSVSFNIRGS